MRSFINTAFLIVLFLLLTPSLKAQSVIQQVIEVDSLKQEQAADSVVVQKDPFALISEGETLFERSLIKITQTNTIEEAVKRYISNGPNRKLRGYRVRIYFDNKQNARQKSEEIVSLFQENYPEISVYRSYDNPYFKVSVGDLRNRSEAMKLLNRVKKEYPSAFVVRENISFLNF